MADSGIYQIVNTVNNKRYIGSAVNLKKRENEHFAHLRRGVHHSPYLQRSYDLHGRDAFVFEILMYTPRDWCIEIEQIMLDALHPEYNLSIKAGSRLGAPQPESMAKSQSERMKKRWAEMTPEKRKEMSEKVSRNVKNYWKNRTPEERRIAAQRASDASREKYLSLSEVKREQIRLERSIESQQIWDRRTTEYRINHGAKISAGKRKK